MINSNDSPRDPDGLKWFSHNNNKQLFIVNAPETLLNTVDGRRKAEEPKVSAFFFCAGEPC